MFPIIFIIITAVFIYRTSRDNGYNAVLWTVLAVVGFLVVQVIFGMLIGVILAVGLALWGWSPTLLADYGLLISLAALVPSIGFVWLIWRHVNKVIDDGRLPDPPPPPPTFNPPNES